MKLRLDSSLRLASILFCSIGVWLFLYQLTLVGTTWDEYVDFAIARDFAHNLNFFGNTVDPSQGRLSHLPGAVALRVFGDSVVVFKIPYVVTGLLGGLLLFLFTRKRAGTTVALLIAAYYLTNPFVLASSRTAGTAGDILVLVTTFGFLWAGIRWIESPEAFGDLVLFAVVTGLCVGSKLTNLILVPLGAVIVFVSRALPIEKSRVSAASRDVMAFVCISATASVLAHPPFLNGPGYMLDVLRQAGNFGGSTQYLLGDFHAGTPVVYLGAILLAKFGIPFTAVLVAAIIYGIGRLARRSLDLVSAAAMLGVAMTGLFVVKDFQNANYYVPLVVPALILTATLLAASAQSRNAVIRHGALIGFLAVVVHQTLRTIALTPDYLQAGREFGARFQGEFGGPAVNHCQGSPMVIDALNQMPGARELSPIYVVEHCLPIVNHDNELGAVRAQGFSFQQFDAASPPKGEHVVIVHNVIHVYRPTVKYHKRAMEILADATRGCEKWMADPHRNDPFEIYRCSDSIF